MIQKSTRDRLSHAMFCSSVGSNRIEEIVVSQLNEYCDRKGYGIRVKSLNGVPGKNSSMRVAYSPKHSKVKFSSRIQIENFGYTVMDHNEMFVGQFPDIYSAFDASINRR